jgi:tRNA U38,U39,U40 pseudouridine synthase TruA
MKLESLSEILESKDRRKAGFTAPAKGLTLMKVYY